MENEVRDAGSDIGRVFAGLLVIGVGVMLLLDGMDFPYVIRLDARHWPFALMLLGTVRVLYPPPERGRGAGAWLLCIGVWGYVSEFHVMGLDYATSWPILVIAAGLVQIARAVEGPRACRAIRS